MDRVLAVLRNLWLVLAVLFLSARVGVAEVDLSATLTFGPKYVPETWIPLKVEAYNRGAEMLEGTVRVTPLDPLVPEFRSPIRVPGLAKVRTIMWVRLTASAGQKPEVAGITLHDAQGARVQISELVGRPAVPVTSYQPNGLANSGYIVGVLPSDSVVEENQLPDEMAQAIEAAMDWKVPLAMVDPSLGAQMGQLYGGAYAVALVGLDPRKLEATQRQAILDYVIGGGVLLLPGPDPEQFAGSWLEPYLPVRLIGKRQMEALSLAGQERPVSLGKWVPITEALAAEGTVLWQDTELVHAAYRPLGLGRIVFTSFPASVLKGAEPQTQEFWREALWLNRPPVGTSGSKIAEEYGRLMEPMLGRQAASWKLAIGAACMVVLLTVGAQFIWRGAARPRAYAVSLGMSVALAAGFTGMSLLRQQADPLQYATLTVADVSSAGSTLQQYAALAGPPQQLSQTATSNTATVYPVLLREERPVISQWPAHLGPISVSSGQVKQVTRAQEMLPDMKGTVRAQFGQEGLRLEVENGTGAELDSAQLVWGGYRLAAGGFAAGSSSRVLTGADLRPAGEFAATSGVVSQDQLQKGEILRSLLQQREGLSGTRERRVRSLIAFADRVPALSTVEGAKLEQELHRNAVRMRVEVQPSPAGAPVRIDGCFNRTGVEQVRNMPFYHPGENQFLSTAIQGAWVFCIEPPPEIGAVKLTHARVRIDLAAPQHKITLRRGQCQEEKRKANPNGEVIGQWDGQAGLQTAEFDCRAEDFDTQGRLWLRLEAQQSGQAGSIGVEPHWQIQQLLVDLEGQVRGEAK